MSATQRVTPDEILEVRSVIAAVGWDTRYLRKFRRRVVRYERKLQRNERHRNQG